MDSKTIELIDLKDNMINSFRPIENVFKTMNISQIELYGNELRLYSEIGIFLCQSFRCKIEEVFNTLREGVSNGK